MSAKASPDHVRMGKPDGSPYHLVRGGPPDVIGHCTRCGSTLTVAIPETGSLTWLTTTLRAFVKDHRRCLAEAATS